MNCQYCGQRMEDGSTACPRCGASAEPAPNIIYLQMPEGWTPEQCLAYEKVFNEKLRNNGVKDKVGIVLPRGTRFVNPDAPQAEELPYEPGPAYPSDYTQRYSGTITVPNGSCASVMEYTEQLPQHNQYYTTGGLAEPDEDSQPSTNWAEPAVYGGAVDREESTVGKVLHGALECVTDIWGSMPWAST
jgi:hypothetical protein